MSKNSKTQQKENVLLTPTITVFGVGGAGGNAINNMIHSNLQGAIFVAANTDAQALEHSAAQYTIQLGSNTTRGLGAGASPDIGMSAAEESAEEIRDRLYGSNMVFITAGMGGGTGTGAAPVVAKIAKDLGILTVGVVTKPFHFEGQYRMSLAERGLNELQKYVDTLIIIPNQNLFRIANERTTFADAFKMADDVLHAGVRGVTDLMIMPGLINLDFADIRAVMTSMGKAMMGTGEASGDDRAIKAAEAAIANPLLDHCSMKGAKGVLINITGGMDMTLFEVDAAANRIREEVGENTNANIIFGSTFSNALDGTIRVSVVATGIDSDELNHTRNNTVQEALNTRNINSAKNMSGASYGNNQGSRSDSNDNVATFNHTTKVVPAPLIPEEKNATHHSNNFTQDKNKNDDTNRASATKPSIFNRVMGIKQNDNHDDNQSRYDNRFDAKNDMSKQDTTKEKDHTTAIKNVVNELIEMTDASEILEVPTFLRRR